MLCLRWRNRRRREQYGNDATDELGPIRLAWIWGDGILVTLYQAPLGRRLDVAALGGRIHWIFVAVLLVSATACTIGPNFTAPVAPLAEKFRDVDNRSARSGPLEYQNWWEGFRDPTLNKLIQIASNQNLTLLSAGTRVLQARAVLGIAIGVSYP